MEIKIANQTAVLKKGTSFEYVAENRLFGGSDGYTLTMTFPLRGCGQNLAIFGRINRKDVLAERIRFDCEIRHGRFYKFGTVTITEISESEVKCQFLEGRSEQNFADNFDETYINELDLGEWPAEKPAPTTAWSPGSDTMPRPVALPWVNKASGNLQNAAEVRKDSHLMKHYHYSWDSELQGLSWQPYLVDIVKRICGAVDYSIDLTEWLENDRYRYLLVCNTLPYAWNMEGFAVALPHWTVAEFFEKLELFLGAEFDINHRSKSINFRFTDSILEELPEVKLDRIVDEHTVEVSAEETRCDYVQAKNLVYKECDHEMSKFYSCDWYLEYRAERAVEYATLAELIEATKMWHSWNGNSRRNSDIDKLYYAKDVDCYFVIRTVERTENEGANRNNLKYIYRCVLEPVNYFGNRLVDESEDAQEQEIEFVPAWIDETEYKVGRALYLSFSGYDDSGTDEDAATDLPDWDEIRERWQQTMQVQVILAGDREKKGEFYDRFYIGWWDGRIRFPQWLPHPMVTHFEISPSWEDTCAADFSLKISRGILSDSVAHKINPKQKVNIRFLSDSVPNPRAVFHIHGKRYVCEKLTATFTESGMSQLIKGIFYPIASSTRSWIRKGEWL